MAFGVVFRVLAELGGCENSVILEEDRGHVLVGGAADGNKVLSFAVVEPVGGDAREEGFSVGVMGLGS